MHASSIKSRLGSLALALGAVAWLGACTDTVTRTVFVDRPPYNPAPDAAGGFLGYYTDSTQQTTCGNCHVDHQADWRKHGHSGAYQALVNSPNAQPACYGCHTVSQYGNAVDTAAGWNKVPDAAYHDVQCENCHGPGETHVKTPDASAPPLSRLAADTALNSGTCGECHTGTHQPFVEQWRQSRHAEPVSDVIQNYITNPATYGQCLACHEGRSAARALGSTANYKERNDPINHTTALGITCAVCHDPHGNDNAGELRFPIDVFSLSENLCMKCHGRRFEPQTTSSRGPHAPQGPTLIGTAGWFPPGVDTTPQATTHGDPIANPRLCAGCHIVRTTLTDGTGAQFTSVGHLFRPIPCLDPNGIPIGGNSCGYTQPERLWTGCVKSGCHGNVGAAVAAFDANRLTTANLADQIWVDVDASGTVNAGDTGYLPQVPTTEFSTTDGKITPAEGALFNLRLIGEGRYENGDKSLNVHNPFLGRKLLATSITALQTTYALPAPPAAIQALIRESLAKAEARGHAPVIGTN